MLAGFAVPFDDGGDYCGVGCCGWSDAGGVSFMALDLSDVLRSRDFYCPVLDRIQARRVLRNIAEGGTPGGGVASADAVGPEHGSAPVAFRCRYWLPVPR